MKPMEGATQSPLEKRPLYRDEIKDILMEMIICGDLKPGDRIVETKFARELGISQSPIREAIRELEMLGLVTNLPYKGTIVRETTSKEIREIYIVRHSLESTAIYYAIKYFDDVDLDYMRDLLLKMQKAADDNDYLEYIRVDVMYHEYFVDLSRNDMLKKLWEQCNIRAATHMGTRHSAETLQTLADRHIEIFEALEARDSKLASHAIKMHYDLLLNELND